MRIGQALSNSGACYKYAETLLVGPVAAGLLQFTVVEKVSLVRQVCAVPCEDSGGIDVAVGGPVWHGLRQLRYASLGSRCGARPMERASAKSSWTTGQEYRRFFQLLEPSSSAQPAWTSDCSKKRVLSW